MKIDNSVGSVGGLPSGEPRQRPGKNTPSAASASSEKVELSSLAGRMQEIEAALANVPVADAGRVAEIKQAMAEGRFKEQIVPVELKTRKGVTLFDTDEHPRADTTAESLGSLKPVFKKDGTVTAGNASSINDGAASVVLVSAREAARRGMTPMARVVAWGHAGVAPEVMGLGPVPAVPIALQRAGLTIADIDVIESNEAFAAQACAVSKELGFPAERTNPNGGAVALGHPVGATGVIITVKTLYELQRTGGRFGLMTMCIGGGQGIAVIVERL